MMKTIAWHKNYLENWNRTLLNRQVEMERLQEAMAKDMNDTRFYDQQIATAETEGKVGFDRERYLVSRRQK